MISTIGPFSSTATAMASPTRKTPLTGPARRVFHELQTWRTLMPWALTTGHSQGYPHPEIAEIFNGQGIGFDTTDVIEGKKTFQDSGITTTAWCTVTVKPAITSVESAVPDQIAYGYDYSPQSHRPPQPGTSREIIILTCGSAWHSRL